MKQGTSLIDSLFGRDGRHLAFGMCVLLVLVALFFVSVVGGFTSIQLVCVSFVVGAFVDSIAIPRLSPVKTTKYDESTPVTSFILGNRISTLSTNYLLLEIIVMAVMLHFGFQRVTLAVYLQAAMMIVYLSLVAYLTGHPGKSERAEDDPFAEGADDVAPAHTSKRHADDSKPIANDRMEMFVKALVATLPYTKDAELKRQINKLIDALKKCPPDTYESMDDVDHQMAALIAELRERVEADEIDIANECVMLTLILSNQRTALYDQIMAKRRGEREEGKGKGKKRRR